MKTRLHTNLFFASILIVLGIECQAQIVTRQRSTNAVSIVSGGRSTTIQIDKDEYPGVLRAVSSFAEDVQRVTDLKPAIVNDLPVDGTIVIAGTIGKSKAIDELISKKKVSAEDIIGKWESSFIQTVANPFPGIKEAVVIAGSDKRGTIFGIYELSKQIGVSPWYWWADVPTPKSKDLFVKAGRYKQGEPAVRYRGIFINDEEPALGRWAVEKYGGFNHQMYEKVFELILRLKGNYLWPAMWWASFNGDDPINPDLADEYGIVMSTTHHEPMMRAHADWKAFKGSNGPWDYDKNEAKLREFWAGGIKKMGSRESIVSMGMRGDGDMAMTAETNIALLERIVADQRKIIAEVTGKSPEKTPQLWALYKEVQDYYDRGMRVPDDVTLLLCDDNWGNIRKLPKLTDAPRSGGYGIYYHFDYVGGPRNYKWVNTSHLSRVREQMNLALQYGADRIWVVNVGDIKPMELPISFFLDFAWDPKPWGSADLHRYTVQWAEQQFGLKNANEIARIISNYTKYNSRRKPELLAADTYSLTNYQEAETIVAEYNKLASDAEKIYGDISAEYKDAYYQLVLYPVVACANLNELWVTVGKNRLFAKQGRALTNELASKARALFARDSILRYQYNNILSGGKWHHMMDQNHISYTYWQQPDKDLLPDVKLIDVPVAASMGVTPEGSYNDIVAEQARGALPLFSESNQTHYLEIYNKGATPFNFTINADKSWIRPIVSEGKIETERRIPFNVDWVKVPQGTSTAMILVAGPNGQTATINATITNPKLPSGWKGFTGDGYISIEAADFSKAIDGVGIKWETLPGIGRTRDGVSVSPVTAASQVPGGNSPRLEYSIFLQESGDFNVQAYFSPTLNFHVDGLRYAISIDDEAPQIVNIHEGYTHQAWDKWVADNIIIKSTKHSIKAGPHTLKFWMVDSGVVLQKIVVGTDQLKPSYLGPPESHWKK